MVRLSIAAAFTFVVAAMALTPNVAGAKDVGNGQSAQFTTGGCVNDADCAEGCCAGGATDAAGGEVGICSGNGAEFQNGKTGCGFVDPNAAATIAAAKKQVAKQGF
ncbi:Uu.00g085200.m01.CDS01 [Anthostomella pinea]|uniref:Uu.00g085200.m01.CDS01 n=1 Tax=Anthostomella pinea TaxID=933095 RepID=A0AAI8YHD3_9PEZI|nr:Uu.00g085200.m01.CDS01 [Anthostomella pinea]